MIVTSQEESSNIPSFKLGTKDGRKSLRWTLVPKNSTQQKQTNHSTNPLKHVHYILFLLFMISLFEIARVCEPNVKVISRKTKVGETTKARLWGMEGRVRLYQFDIRLTFLGWWWRPRWRWWIRSTWIQIIDVIEHEGQTLRNIYTYV